MKSSLNCIVKNILKKIGQNIIVHRTFTHAIKPLSVHKMVQKNPSSHDFEVSIPIFESNRLPKMILCVQQNPHKNIKLIEHWYINRYQENSKIVKRIAKANHVQPTYSHLPHSSRLGITISKDCNLKTLDKDIISYILAVIEISNYLQVNSYIDGPNTLNIQKLNY